MNDKFDFIALYLDDYVRMAYRELINKVDNENEDKLICNLKYLLDKYAEGELLDYIHYNEVV